MNRLLGRISEQHHTIYKVLFEDGTVEETRVAGKFTYQNRKNTQYPVVGDYVVLNESGLIEAVQERKTVLQRMEAGTTKRSQVIVSNLDIIFVCMAMNQDFNLRRLERYLSMVYGSNIKPVIILTKADLVKNSETFVKQVKEEFKTVSVIACSGETKNGVDQIKEMLTEGITASFIGSSGIGKSTLVNALCGDEVLKTSRVREYDGKGRHTTTHRQLIRLNNGSYLVDTPGMRGLALDQSNVGEAFDDIEELAAECKYRNCTHKAEQGCAILQAIEEGTLSSKRYRSYIKLKKEEDNRRKLTWRR